MQRGPSCRRSTKPGARGGLLVLSSKLEAELVTCSRHQIRASFKTIRPATRETLSKGLVIVESPAKAKTIQKYLGKGFTVEASLGHVKDLPKSTLGVDTENEFDTEYIVIPGKEKVLVRLKKLAESADHIYLAPDPDREGEAIAAHLADELDGNGAKKKKKKTKSKKKDENGLRIQRVTFNEITQRAVREAFEHPREIDQNLVDAQQARRVLDRLVGYQVSPLLWDKVRRGLSAG